RPRAEHADFHHDVLVGHGKVGALTLDECCDQNERAERHGYPGVAAPGAAREKPRRRQQDDHDKKKGPHEKQPVQPRAKDNVLAVEKIAVDIAHDRGLPNAFLTAAEEKHTLTLPAAESLCHFAPWSGTVAVPLARRQTDLPPS